MIGIECRRLEVSTSTTGVMHGQEQPAVPKLYQSSGSRVPDANMLETLNPGNTDSHFTAGARDRRLAHQEAARQSQRTRAEPHPSQNLAVQRVMAQSGGQVLNPGLQACRA
jgi:hypothetical protein